MYVLKPQLQPERKDDTHAATERVAASKGARQTQRDAKLIKVLQAQRTPV